MIDGEEDTVFGRLDFGTGTVDANANGEDPVKGSNWLSEMMQFSQSIGGAFNAGDRLILF